MPKPKILVKEEKFRHDLYYRLNVFPIVVPPLRERREDISLLVRHFTMKCGLKLGKRIESIPERTMKALVAYPWPGNVRELNSKSTEFRPRSRVRTCRKSTIPAEDR